MAWNQPGNNGQDRDPWGSSKPGGNSEGNGNKGGRDQGPPDLDDIFRKLSKKLGGLGGGKGTGSGGGSSSQGPRPQLGGRVVTIAAAAIVIIWAASGFYTIKEAERGVVTRFGKFSHLVEPGLNWKPTFIDEVKPVNVEAVRELAASGVMLTSDENVVRVEMNVQFPAQTVRATVIGAGAHTLSLSGSTIWLEGVQLPLRNLPVAIPIDETDLVSAWQQALIQLDLCPKTDAYVLALPASLPVRYAAVLTVINALVDFVARFPNPHPLLVVAGQDFGKALGMLLRPQLQQLPLAVIDEVIVRAGDYIDIGTPLFGGSVVPVTVKSLAFPS